MILDLDNTLIHAHPVRTIPLESCLPANVFHIRLSDRGRNESHLVKKRNYLDEFLSEASKCFQLSVYTHGLRGYAEGIVKNIDPTGKLFGSRIVSRLVNVPKRTISTYIFIKI